jgi:hypothetical protein
MEPCRMGYFAGDVALICRRLTGHQGDCGPGDEVEQAMCRALEATAHLRKLEREGEKIPPELWNFLMRSDGKERAG